MIKPVIHTELYILGSKIGNYNYQTKYQSKI